MSQSCKTTTFVRKQNRIIQSLQFGIFRAKRENLRGYMIGILNEVEIGIQTKKNIFYPALRGQFNDPQKKTILESVLRDLDHLEDLVNDLQFAVQRKLIDLGKFEKVLTESNRLLRMEETFILPEADSLLEFDDEYLASEMNKETARLRSLPNRQALHA